MISNIFLGIYVLSKDLRICQHLVHLKHSENEESKLKDLNLNGQGTLLQCLLELL